MTRLLQTATGRLRAISLLEGGSYLLLMGIAMPLKYLADLPLAVRVVGMAHGVLFVAFVFALLFAAIERRWSPLRAGWLLLLSMVPFGALRIEQELRQESEAKRLGTPTAG